jgi:ribonuclease Z
MKQLGRLAFAAIASLTLAAAAGPVAEAAPCLMVTLTGTQSGPAVFKGQAGAGTLIRFGDDGTVAP